MEQTPLAVVEAFYAHMAAGQVPEANTLLHPDFKLMQAPSVPYGGDFNKADLPRFFELFFGVWKRFRSEEVRFFANGDAVVATSVGVGETHTGTEVRMPMVQVYTVHNGLMTSTQPFYWDTQALNAALGNER